MTLIELMVAMLISLILIGGAIQLFIASKQSYQLNQSMGYLQSSARHAVLLLKRDIRMAGYFGCNSRGAAALRFNTTYDATSTRMNTLYGVGSGLQGWEATDTGDGEYAVVTDEGVEDMASSNHWTTSATGNDGVSQARPYIGTDSLPRTDAIRLWSLEGEPAVVQAISASSIHLSANPGIEEGEMLLLADCSNVDVVRACDVSGRPGNVTVSTSGCGGLTNDRPPISQPGAYAFALIGKTYFVGRRVDDDVQSAVTLYVREWRDPTNASAQPVLENIESMQFLYGEDTGSPDPDGVANRYVNAAEVTNWNRVVSVRMQILVQSERTDLLQGAQTFAFNGKQNVTANDGRLRYAFISTVALRNRVR